jgi:CubicO group peptidase (beta-lactamase class C family)
MSDGQPPTAAVDELDRFLAGIAQLGGVVSALEALVATSEAIVYRRAAGFRVGGDRLRAESGARFDAASLTKPWMATLAAVLDRDGILPLDTRLGNIFGASRFEKEARTRGVEVAQLLRHQSGMRAWAPLGPRLGKRLADRAALESFLLSESLWAGRNDDSSDRGSSTYSDLGYILWGLAAEQATGRDLGELLDELVCEPLGVGPLGALASRPPHPVECRLDNGKEVELAAEQGVKLGLQRSFHLGVPQDGNARALGFLAGHAGLFVTSDEMLALGREWLRPGKLLSTGMRDLALAGDGAYALGWARPSDDGSSGPALSSSAFGHTGFTGGSLWIDPERERIFVLLAHRLSSRIDFNPFRREFHRLAVQVV